MGFFDNARKAMDETYQKMGKDFHEYRRKVVVPALEVAGQEANNIYQKTGKGFHEYRREKVVPALEVAGQNANNIYQKTGKDFHEYRREVVVPAFENLGQRANKQYQKTGKNFHEYRQEKVVPAAECTKEWIVKNPGPTIAIATSILLPPVAVAVAFLIINAVGFAAVGVRAGSAAASLQAGIGNVAAGSTFAVLQSAGAGGSGAFILGKIVWAGTSAMTWAATIPQLIMASKDGDGNENSEGREERDGDDTIKMEDKENKGDKEEDEDQVRGEGKGQQEDKEKKD